MNKTLFFLVFFLSALFIPISCFADSGRQISVVYCTNIAPFEYTNNKGEPAGLIIDFWKLWSKKTGIRVNFKKALWDTTLEMISKGEVDAHAGLFYNKKRDAYLDYGASLSKTTTHIFFHKTIVIPDTLDQAAAYRIGVIKKDLVEGYLRAHMPSAAITGYKDYKSLTADLKSGKLKVFAADTATGLYYLAREGLTSMFHFDDVKPLYQSDWYIATREGNRAILELINSGMNMITPEQRKKIERKWTSGIPSEDSNAVIIAVSLGYPPFSEINAAGNPTGFLIDLWNEWSYRTGIPIKFRITNWPDTLSGMKAGYADIHSGLFINQDRKQWLHFSTPFFEVETALYVKSGTSPPSLKKMTGKKLGVAKDSYQASFIGKTYPRIKAIPYLNTYDLLTSLFQDQVLAVVAEIPEMKATLERLGLSGALTHGPALFSNTIHAGVLKDNQKLLERINQGFKSIPGKTVLRIKNRWFPRYHPWKVHLKLILSIAIFMLILATIGLLWNYRLRNELIRRKKTARILEEAKKQAESANQAKSTFLANMSHEIRTPMNAILGMNRLALETDLSDNQKHLLKTVQTSSEHLLRLLDDILDFSKIEADKMEIQLQTFSLTALLDTVYAAMYPDARAKGLVLETRIKGSGLPDLLVGDDFRIKQILYNLISNAVKFTDQGVIIVKAELSQDHTLPGKKIKLILSVSDTGIGIQPETQTLIFSSFQQADTSIVRSFGGTGLGLAICQQLARLLGGDIRLESIPGTGTCFYVTLALEEGEQLDHPPVEKDALPVIQEMTILLIEDDAINQDLAKMVLERDHHRVFIADNGLEGLKMLCSHTFDLIFMDIQMPVMDGLTTCKIIRAFETGQPLFKELPKTLVSELGNKLKGRHLPIVAMTANAMDGNRKNCLKAGMDDYITKPFDFEAIRSILINFINPDLIQTRKGDADMVLIPKKDIRSQTKDHLRATYHLDDGQIDQMMITVEKTLSLNLLRAESAISHRDLNELGEIAHSIKGSLLNIGLDDISDTAKTIELHSKEGLDTDYQVLLSQLQKNLVGLLKEG